MTRLINVLEVLGDYLLKLELRRFEKPYFGSLSINDSEIMLEEEMRGAVEINNIIRIFNKDLGLNKSSSLYHLYNLKKHNLIESSKGLKHCKKAFYKFSGKGMQEYIKIKLDIDYYSFIEGIINSYNNGLLSSECSSATLIQLINCFSIIKNKCNNENLKSLINSFIETRMNELIKRNSSEEVKELISKKGLRKGLKQEELELWIMSFKILLDNKESKKIIRKINDYYKKKPFILLDHLIPWISARVLINLSSQKRTAFRIKKVINDFLISLFEKEGLTLKSIDWKYTDPVETTASCLEAIIKSRVNADLNSVLIKSIQNIINSKEEWISNPHIASHVLRVLKSLKYYFNNKFRSLEGAEELINECLFRLWHKISLWIGNKENINESLLNADISSHPIGEIISTFLLNHPAGLKKSYN